MSVHGGIITRGYGVGGRIITRGYRVFVSEVLARFGLTTYVTIKDSFRNLVTNKLQNAAAVTIAISERNYVTEKKTESTWVTIKNSFRVRR